MKTCPICRIDAQDDKNYCRKCGNVLVLISDLLKWEAKSSEEKNAWLKEAARQKQEELNKKTKGNILYEQAKNIEKIEWKKWFWKRNFSEVKELYRRAAALGSERANEALERLSWGITEEAMRRW